MFAIGSLLVVMAVSLLITRVATVILVATGMSRANARFQARSAFTGAGFTTNESEAVVRHPVRRKVIMWLMLLGNAGIVASASTLILGFRGGDAGAAWKRAVELAGGLIALLYLSRSSLVDRWLTRTIRAVLARTTDLPQRDAASLLELDGPYVVVELAVRSGDWLAGRTLAELRLRDEEVIVLGVRPRDGRYVGVPDGATRLAAGDILVLYGHEQQLCELDDRRAGSDGERRHAEAAARR